MRKKVSMYTQNKLPNVFSRRNGFVCTHVCDNNVYELGSEFKGQVNHLIKQGEKIVIFNRYRSKLTSHFFLERAPESSQLLLMNERTTDHEEPRSWQEIVEIVVKEMNGYRVLYNELLKVTQRVTNVKIHFAPITFQCIHMISGWDILLRIQSDRNNARRYFFYAANTAHRIAKPMPFARGSIQREAMNGSVFIAKTESDMYGKKNPVYLSFQVSPVKKVSLTMLTPENVFQERILKPLPFEREPTLQ